jgi:hypothetical protein
LRLQIRFTSHGYCCGNLIDSQALAAPAATTGRQPIRLAERNVDHVNRGPVVWSVSYGCDSFQPFMFGQAVVLVPSASGQSLMNSIALGFTLWLLADAIDATRKQPTRARTALSSHASDHCGPLLTRVNRWLG